MAVYIDVQVFDASRGLKRTSNIHTPRSLSLLRVPEIYLGISLTYARHISRPLKTEESNTVGALPEADRPTESRRLRHCDVFNVVSLPVAPSPNNFYWRLTDSSWQERNTFSVHLETRKQKR